MEAPLCGCPRKAVASTFSPGGWVKKHEVMLVFYIYIYNSIFLIPYSLFLSSLFSS